MQLFARYVVTEFWCGLHAATLNVKCTFAILAGDMLVLLDESDCHSNRKHIFVTPCFCQLLFQCIYGKYAYYNGIKTMYYCQVLKLLFVGVYRFFITLKVL
jgi:hypothetical protein